MASRISARRFCATAFVLLAFASPALALAGPSPTNTVERDTARRLMDEGKARMKSNEPLRAVESFQKAHDIMRVPTTGLALAKAHLAAGHLIEARDLAADVARLPREPGEPAIFEAARRQAKELDVQLRPRIPTLRIRVKGTAVRVTIDDVELALSSVSEPVPVNPGKRVVTAKSADGIEAKGEIELGEREVREIELSLTTHAEPGAKSPPPPVAAGPTPPPTPTAAPRVHGLGRDDVDPRDERQPAAQGLIYGGAVVGGVGLAVGFITGGLTLSKAGDVRPQCDNNVCAPTAQDDLDGANTLATVSTVAFVVGLAGAAACAIGFALPRHHPHASHASLAIGPAGIGGTF